MKEIFQNYVETSFDGHHQASFKFGQFKYNYQRYFELKNCQDALDIGIGRGEMLSCMQKWSLNYLGIDISPSTVAFCSSLKLNCQLVDDTASWLMSRAESFDVITCLDVLEHVPKEHTVAFVEGIRHSLREGGIAIIQVPNLQCPEGFLHHFNDFTHVSGFVEHSLAQVLLAAGLKEFSFHDFEETYTTGIKPSIRKILRCILRSKTKLTRRIHGNLNPSVLAPVMYAVARKTPGP